MKCLVLFFLLIPQMSFCQNNLLEDEDYKVEIEKDIFRVLMALKTDPGLSITACYEREIKRPFTFFLQAGPFFSREYLFTDAFGDEQYVWYARAQASAEVRYYFNLFRRIKHKKITQNFSADYFSIEPYVSSKTLIILNKFYGENKRGLSGAYINWGYQKQVKVTCIGAFFGTRFPGKIYSNSVDVFDIIHGGITVGRVF